MKIDRVIEIVRQYKLDEMMTAGAGGFTGSADAAGPVAGYDPVMEPPTKKKKKYIGLGKNSRKRWMT
jgi:hypothetical protein